MRLLFDHNVSPRLIGRLVDLFPDALHVSALGLDRADDTEVWSYAAAHDCAIVTKDADFNEFVTVRGFPPKVVWLRLGNCGTGEIEQALRGGHAVIASFLADSSAGLLMIMKPVTGALPSP